MDRVGTWCVDAKAAADDTGGASLTACHNRGMMLCPLEAILTCDAANVGSLALDSCNSRTDGATPHLTRTLGHNGTGSAFGTMLSYSNTNDVQPVAEAFMPRCSTTSPAGCLPLISAYLSASNVTPTRAPTKILFLASLLWSPSPYLRASWLRRRDAPPCTALAAGRTRASPPRWPDPGPATRSRSLPATSPGSSPTIRRAWSMLAA